MKGRPENETYIGPMAQDWHGMFPSSKDSLRIDTIDLDGVALAALKGLTSLVRKQESTIKDLQTRLSDLEKKGDVPY